MRSHAAVRRARTVPGLDVARPLRRLPDERRRGAAANRHTQSATAQGWIPMPANQQLALTSLKTPYGQPVYVLTFTRLLVGSLGTVRPCGGDAASETSLDRYSLTRHTLRQRQHQRETVCACAEGWGWGGRAMDAPRTRDAQIAARQVGCTRHHRAEMLTLHRRGGG
jgi:hypothetical protein